ncbi:MAG: zinc ribbon domain-containing protein [Gammaproteobacteria bacterium]
MPIYEYQCEHCEHKMEAIQKFSDDPLRECPECKQETLRKLVSAAAFKLKGDGWYETDFKDKKPQKKDAKGKEEDSQSSKDKGSDKTGGSDKSGKKSESKTVTAKKKTSTASSSD